MLKAASTSSSAHAAPTAAKPRQRSSLPAPAKGRSASAMPRKNAASRWSLHAGGMSFMKLGALTKASRIQPETWSMDVPGRSRANTRADMMKTPVRSPSDISLAGESKLAIVIAWPTSGLAPYSGLRGSVFGTTAVTVYQRLCDSTRRPIASAGRTVPHSLCISSSLIAMVSGRDSVACRSPARLRRFSTSTMSGSTASSTAGFRRSPAGNSMPP